MSTLSRLRSWASRRSVERRLLRATAKGDAALLELIAADDCDRRLAILATASRIRTLRRDDRDDEARPVIANLRSRLPAAELGEAENEFMRAYCHLQLAEMHVGTPPEQAAAFARKCKSLHVPTIFRAVMPVSEPPRKVVLPPAATLVVDIPAPDYQLIRAREK